MTVPGKGPSHRFCQQIAEAQTRYFHGLNITQLSDQELTELKDLILSEINIRNRPSGHSDIELF